VPKPKISRLSDPHIGLDLPDSSSLGRMTAAAKRRFARFLGLAAAQLLTPTGLEDPDVRAKLWRKGIAAQPKGFYASLVDPTDLPPGNSAASLNPGLNLNRHGQLRYLKEIFPRYRDEYAGIPLDRPSSWSVHPRFFLRNDAFHNLDALAYWAMIRSHRPNRIVEVGSGFSTLLAAEAIGRNGTGRVTAVDPFPREFIQRNDLGIDIVKRRAEEVEADLFLSLRADDIVFVDSSHVVRQGGDVNWFFLKILPQLRDGVLVHIHDIHFPFDYSLEFVRQRNVYWTEQYLLHCYLLKNPIDEVLFSSRYSAHFFPDQTRAAFPLVEKMDGGSLWMRVHDQATLDTRPV
jgi:Methyltransferase domain